MAGLWSSLREIFKSEPPPTRVEVTDFARDLVGALVTGGFSFPDERKEEEPDIVAFYDTQDELHLILLGRTKMKDPQSFPKGPCLSVKFIFGTENLVIQAKGVNGQFIKKPVEDEPYEILIGGKEKKIKYSQILCTSNFTKDGINFSWSKREKLIEHIRLWTQNHASYETGKKLTNLSIAGQRPSAPPPAPVKPPEDFDAIVAQLQGGQPPKSDKTPGPGST